MRYIVSARLRIILMGSVASATLSGGVAQPAQAQALQPVVEVCSGITLPRSAVTDIIGAVNAPIVEQVESTVNGLTTVTLLLGPLVGFEDLNLDLTSILDDAAEGDPITLQILDTEGNILTPSDDCNVMADGFTLAEEGGLSIGGNTITGLGADGQVASAAELDAIALGNNASTAAGAGGAVAIGTGATASAANSVALGAGSVADRGAVAGYSAPGLTGTFDSAGSVSVGAPGAERQITNVAPGTAATDAATVGQVQGALAAVAALDANAVQYDDAGQGSVTLAGVGGTVIANLADGAVAAGSTQAVNGSQLFATNQAVSANAADIAALGDAAVQYDDASHTSVTLDGSGGTTLDNVRAGTISATSTEAVTGAQLFATNQAIAALGDGSGTGGSGLALTYDDATFATATLGGADGTTLTNVAAGDVSASSSDAVNGAQLFATNEAVAANADDITNLDVRVTTNEGDIANLDNRVTVNEGDISNLDIRVTDNSSSITVLQEQVANAPVRYVADADRTTPSAVPTNTVALVAASGGAAGLTNIAAGALAADSTDAVNGAQLYATNQQVAQNAEDITIINNNLQGSTVVAVQYADPGSPTRSNGGTITNDVTLVGADADAAVALHNVADGVLANDAANMGQLRAGLDGVLTDSMAYTDLRVAQLGFDLADVRRDAFSGTASAMAVAGIPQTMEEGRSMVGGGIGHFRGQTAFAIGASTTFSLSETIGVVKAGATMDTHGKGGFSAGAGFSF